MLMSCTTECCLQSSIDKGLATTMQPQNIDKNKSYSGMSLYPIQQSAHQELCVRIMYSITFNVFVNK